MEQRFYNRRLLRLIGLPIVALAILAVVLGYGLQDVEGSARQVDRSDRIIAQADSVFRLMIDEETNLRGYLLTRDPAFFQTMRDADVRFNPYFDQLSDAVHSRPDQVERLRRINAAHDRWELETAREVAYPVSAAETETQLLSRKQSMDTMRAEMTAFLQREQNLRNQQAARFVKEDARSEVELAALMALIAIIIAFVTQRFFMSLTRVHSAQLTEIKATGQICYEREQWLNTTLRSIGDAVIACDEHGRVVFMNPVAEHLTGWAEPAAKGKHLPEVFPIFNEDTKAIVENPVDKVRRLGTIVGLANHTFLVRKDGKEICIDDSGAPIRNDRGEMIGVVMVFRDITDRRTSEEALMRAEKLAAAGRLAASVAHEVNNPLEGLTNLVYIARTTDEMEEVRTLLTQAEQELGRIAHITRQSLGFYREVTSTALYNPSGVIRQVSDFYRTRALSMGVSLIIQAETEMDVMGIAGEIRQVFSNLLANSLDASSPGSRIRINTRAACDPRNSSLRGVRISIADSGTGISSIHLEEIFEPFFTTKKDTGTGLGLWVSRQLVEKHGGTLRLRSRMGGTYGGTTFSAFLPASGKTHEAPNLSEYN